MTANLPRTDREIIIPIICENPACRNRGRRVNAVSGIPLADMDLFYEGYGDGDPADNCPACGKLGIAHDPVFAQDSL
ncbi:MAG: hypothetical protein OD918_07630 [Gammaproteobacteria bacterium]